MRRVLLLALSSTILFSVPARANWSPNGITLLNDPSHPIGAAHLATNGSGEVIGWAYCYGGGSGSIIRARLVLRDGTVPANWDLTNPPSDATCGVPDGAGGFLRASTPIGGEHPDVYAWRVQPAGGLAPGWPGNGLLVAGSMSSEILAQIAPDGTGAGIVAYLDYPSFVRTQRALASGSLDASWPAAGVVLNGAGNGSIVSDGLLAVPDGAGGACVLWESDEPRVARVTQSGALDASWPAGGLALSSNGSPAPHHLLAVIPSGSTHFIAGWLSGTTVVLQRFGLDGTIDANWSGGVMVAAGSVPVLVSDGSAGALVAWQTGADVVGTRLKSDATFAAGWPASGRSLLGGANSAASSSSTVVAAGPAGGVVVCWNDTRRPGRELVRARWLLADGEADPSQPDSGIVASPTATAATVRDAVSDGNGGVFIVWQSNLGFGGYDLDATWLPYPSGTVGVSPDTGTAAPALSAFPNPARDRLDVRFALATNAPARLELLDLAGRSVRRSEVSGAGEHVASFPDLGPLPPGIYTVRLSRDAHAITTRVVVVR